MDKRDFIYECFKQASEKLLKNGSEQGLLAALPKNPEGDFKKYNSLFSRDIGVSSIGILKSGNPDLIKLLKTSLETLAKAQSDLGQLPHFYRPEEGVIRWWHPGALDNTLWWAIACLLYFKTTKDQEFYDTYQDKIDKAFNWAMHQDTNNDGLLEQGEAGDWRDEMPNSGTTIYGNSLWYWLVSLRIEVEGKTDLQSLKDQIYEGVNTLLWIYKINDNAINYIPENNYTKNNYFVKGLMEHINSHLISLPHYLSYVSHRSYGARFDSFGNILACIVGLADHQKAASITDFCLRASINHPYPVKALYPPIFPGEDDFKEYMLRRGQNYPFQYHNGGVWPFLGGFWVMHLSKMNKPLAEQELYRVAHANSLNNWEFNEYLHGQYGTPMGTPNQSWNMSMFIAAFKTLYIQELSSPDKEQIVVRNY